MKMTAPTLFIKHLFTSIKRRPLQPFLLVLVLTLSVAVCIMAVDIGIYLPENSEKAEKEQYGAAEYLLTSSNQSDTRFILQSELQQVLPEGVEVCGVFGVPMTCGAQKEFVYGVATDLTEVSRIFTVRLSESVRLPSNKKTDGIYLSAQLADEHGLGVGDKISFTAAGAKKTFFVCGISPTLFMGKYGAMFDMQALQSILQKDSLLFSYFSNDFSPYNEVYLKTNGKAEETIRAIQEHFPDKKITAVEEKKNTALNMVEDVVFLMVLLTVFYSAVVIYCCFSVLSLERKEQTDLFFGVGAVRPMLYLTSAAEMALYWIFGTVLGVLLSVPISKGILSAAYLGYCEFSLHPKSVLIAASTSFLSAEGGLGFFILGEQFRKRKKAKKKNPLSRYVWVALLSTGVLATVGCVFCKPNTFMMILSCFAAICVLLSEYFLGKQIVVFHAIRKEKSLRKGLYNRFALKNMKKTPPIGTTVGLLSIVFIVIFSMILLLNVAEAEVQGLKQCVNADYYIVNGSAEAIEKLAQTEGVAKTSFVYIGIGEVAGEERSCCSVDDKELLFEGYKLERLPIGKEVFISGLLADAAGLKIGDTVSVKIGTTEYEGVFMYRFESSVIEVIIDAEYCGLSKSDILVVAEEGYNVNALYDEIMNRFGYDNITVLTAEEYFKNWIDMINNYLLCAKILVVFIVFLALVGIADNIGESYRSRKEEFSCYIAAGMNRAGVKKMILSEIGQSVGLSLAVFCTAIVPMFFVIYEAMRSFLIDMFNVWQAAGIL